MKSAHSNSHVGSGHFQKSWQLMEKALGMNGVGGGEIAEFKACFFSL